MYELKYNREVIYMDEKEFGLRLSVLRNQKGVSARDMSLSIGQNPAYINHIENGRSTPSFPVFTYICEYLGISEKEFFDIELSNPEKLRNIIEYLKKLDDKKLSAVENIVKELAKK